MIGIWNRVLINDIKEWILERQTISNKVKPPSGKLQGIITILCSSWNRRKH